jgi:hypothetical protein
MIDSSNDVFFAQTRDEVGSQWRYNVDFCLFRGVIALVDSYNPGKTLVFYQSPVSEVAQDNVVRALSNSKAKPPL